MVTILSLTAMLLSSPPRQSEWQEPYRPTKLEWLELQLNANFREDCITGIGRFCLSVSFASEAPSRMLILVGTIGEVPLAIYEKKVAQWRDLAGTTAKRYGREQVTFDVRRIGD